MKSWNTFLKLMLMKCNYVNEPLWIADNDYEHILKEISPISFPNLTSLSLSNSQYRDSKQSD